MYVLDFMGLAVLDPEFSRPMLPWVVREVIFRADPRQVQMTIKEMISTAIILSFCRKKISPKTKTRLSKDIYIIMKDDQIEFHEIGESRKAEHAFHSDGYKIKGILERVFLFVRLFSNRGH